LAAIYWTDKENDDVVMDIAFDRWPSLPWVCILFSILSFPVISKRELSLFIKVGSYGVLFVCLVILFIFVYGFIALANTKFQISNQSYTPDTDVWNLSLFKMEFGPLSGMMCLGYYLHNCVIPILRNAKDPSNNKRDMFIGYFLVFISYVLVGIAGYIGFSGKIFDSVDKEGNFEIR